MIWWFAWIGWSVAAPNGCGGWVRSQVPEIRGEIREPVLAVSEKGLVHGNWYHPGTGQSQYGLLSGTGWHIENLGRGHSDMLLDKGVAHVVVVDCASKGCTVDVAWREDQKWTRKQALQVEHPITTPSLALGADGLPHLAYAMTVGNASLIMHASPTYGEWHAEKVVTGTARMGPPDLAVDAEGVLHVLFTKERLGGQIIWAHKKEGRWIQQDTGLGRGKEVKLLVGDIGANYAAHFLDGQRVAIQTPANGWVNYGEPLGGSGAVAVGPEGAPQFLLVVDERPLKRLEWVRWTGKGWQRELVAADPFGFRAVAMDLDSRGCPHVLYQHSDSPKTVYARTKL